MHTNAHILKKGFTTTKGPRGKASYCLERSTLLSYVFCVDGSCGNKAAPLCCDLERSNVEQRRGDDAEVTSTEIMAMMAAVGRLSSHWKTQDGKPGHYHEVKALAGLHEG